MAYIEDTNLIEEIKSLKISVGGKEVFPDEAKESVLRVISEQPTADVVEVVRCEKCGYKDVCLQKIDCDYLDREVVYCSYGERK